MHVVFGSKHSKDNKLIHIYTGDKSFRIQETKEGELIIAENTGKELNIQPRAGNSIRIS